MVMLVSWYHVGLPYTNWISIIFNLICSLFSRRRKFQVFLIGSCGNGHKNFVVTNAIFVLQQSTSRHGSKPLKVQVMHTVVVAHQTFCLRLMVWLQKMIEKSGTRPEESDQHVLHIHCILLCEVYYVNILYS